MHTGGGTTTASRPACLPPPCASHRLSPWRSMWAPLRPHCAVQLDLKLRAVATSSARSTMVSSMCVYVVLLYVMPQSHSNHTDIAPLSSLTAGLSRKCFSCVLSTGTTDSLHGRRARPAATTRATARTEPTSTVASCHSPTSVALT